MARRNTSLLFLILLLLPLFFELFQVIALVINSSNTDAEMERKALLEFKAGLGDPLGRLSSWVGGDCRKWKGVDCSNATGHVIKVDLRKPYQPSEAVFPLSGQISDSLLDLKYLNYLDLSSNELSGPIPDSIRNLDNLRNLDLSDNSISGSIPQSIGRAVVVGGIRPLPQHNERDHSRKYRTT